MMNLSNHIFYLPKILIKFPKNVIAYTCFLNGYISPFISLFHSGLFDFFVYKKNFIQIILKQRKIIYLSAQFVN